MPSISVVRTLLVVSSAWVSLVFTGCSGPQRQPADGQGAWVASESSTTSTARQLEPVLVRVSHLHITSQEALDAAKLIGTPERELAAAQQEYTAAEQLLRDGQAAYTAKQFDLSSEKLRAADAAFRRAEEAAVRAGLEQLEHELVVDYGRLLKPNAAARPSSAGPARV